MKRFITGIAMFLLCSMSAHSGSSDFNPGNPPEPETGFALTLSCDSVQAGSVTGEGHYHTGNRVSLTAISNDHYVFISWKEGETVISSAASFSYTMPGRDVHLTAHFEYRQVYLLSLGTVPTAISTTNGGGYYESGKSVTISSSGVSGYNFKGWWEGDSLLSAALSFRFLIPERPAELIARYEYNPSNPGDPNYQGVKHRLYMIAQPSNGGYFANESGVQIGEGETMSQYAYSNTNFVFDGWFHKDTLFAGSTNLNYTMGTADDTLTARYHFDPSSSGEPNPGTTAKYNLSAITQTAALGSNLAFPVYLQNENVDILSANFEMTFPTGVLVDYRNVSLSSRSNGHKLTCDTLGNNIFRFIVSHDTLAPFAGTSGILLTVPVTLPTNWEAGSNHPVLFSNATLGTASGQVSCPVLNGSIGVTALVSNLYASFYTDIYLNRVLFTNLSSVNATTFLWDFGDGQSSTEKNPMHVYAAGGSYEVTLSSSDGVDTKILKMVIDISNENLWTMSGYYSLSKHKNNVKNFTSGFDLFKTLSRCAITGNIFIQVETGETFDTPLDSTLHAFFSQLAAKIVSKNGPVLTFLSDSVQNIPLLDFSGPLHRPYIETVIETATHFRFDKVEMAFSGLKLNPTELLALNDIVICSGHNTPVVDMSVIGNQFNINWKLLKTPLYLNGQLDSGTIRIPSMTLLNDTTFTDSLTYRIQLVSNNYVFYSKEIKYVVQASIYVIPTLLEPVSNTIIEIPTVTFRWKAQGNVLYYLYLWESTTSMPEKPLISGAWTGTYTDNSHCIYGKSYKWRILAKSTCDSIWSVADSFNIGRLPDLAVESLTLSDAEAYAGEAVDVHAVIRNTGGRINSFYWSDRLYLVSGINQQNKLALATSQGWRMLKTDSSYQVDFHAILPLDTVPYSNFMVVADYALNMPEISELNNTKLSEPLHLKHYVLDSTEFEALKHVYENTDGKNWIRPWNLSTKKLIAVNWNGVGFQKGRVVTIDLNQNNLNGSLPADLFNMPYLRTLNMFNNKLSGKLDTLAFAMKEHQYRCDSLTYLNFGANSMKGEISTFANRFPNLRTLYLQSNRFSEIDTVLSRKISDLNLQYQTFSHPDISLSMNPALEIPSLFWYKHETSELMRKDLSIYLMKNNNYLGWINYNASKFAMGLYNDWVYAPTDSVEIMMSNNYVYGSRAKLHMNYPMGDANIDQKTDLLDIQHTLNRIFADYSYPFNRYAANTYPDNQITVQDIVSTVNLLLESGVVVDTTQNALQNNESSRNFLFIANGELMLDIQEPVSALDFSLKNVSDKQLGMLLDNTDFQTMARNTSDGVHFIVFSGSGKEIPAGMTALAQLASEKAQIVSATMANKQAENVPVRIGDFPTDLANGGLQAVQVYLNKSSVTLLMYKPYEQITASVFNMQGQLINQQELNQVTVGSHTIEYSNTLSTGAYLLKLIFQNGKSLQTKNYKWIVSK